MSKKILGIPLAMVLALAICGVALAATAFTVTIPNHVTIVAPAQEPTNNIGVYTDAGCTQVVTNIEWGQLNPGAVLTKTFYVKALGNQTVTVAIQSDLSPAIGTITGDTLVLAPGQSSAYNLTLTVAGGASLGDHNFDTLYVATN